MQIRHSLILLLTATIWGVAFVAQSVGMEYVGPFTFLCARSVIGGCILLPVIAALRRSSTPPHEAPAQARHSRKMLLRGGVCCGVMLCLSSASQQIGLLYTTVGKAGFLTACYILIVPLIGLLFGKKCGRLVWCGVALALVGLYLLCLTGGLRVNTGDLLMLLCAVLFSCHILLVDHFSPHVDGVKMSCIQFFVCAAAAAVGVVLFELPDAPLNRFGFAAPSWDALRAAWQPVLYAGALSSGVGYTLQIIGQRGINPAVASLIMSLESVISVIAGWLLLGQTLTARELCGCALMFIAILLAQLPDTGGNPQDSGQTGTPA
ncbi:MAG: DMT family transporter [Agathobaculum sp.]|uniref:DMT family transporter n=1 Tax=Agathobaculum sp. TaxID=2048138 RepID=UPI0025BAB289|nr:DMT family transporter [Agathobaculum sp.]MCI7125438.1 DMT family transporter [Agathobaculum sp.]MDY3712771.1 DMT family transporter [Agathobaculum sp.]